MKLIYLALPVLGVFTLPALAQPVPLNQGHLEAIDANSDGAVSKQEYDTFANFAFERMDKDADSVLAPDEVDDHLTGDAFDMLDDDKNGSVSQGEFELQMNADFNAADKDGDGLLN